ncbi:MAG TPA: hypothetical protein VFW11_23180 [Cyclobacteriaceae bacterium]|nr:hypothetical protein [Cyclobacteriaceae bacterium]
MINRTVVDNRYAVGTTIRAKINPDLELVIMRYYQRIYYCAVIDNPDHKHFAFFERELLPPAYA